MRIMKITKRQLRQTILEVMSSMDLIDDETITQQFKKWAVEYMGTPSGANSSSVLATFLVQHEYDKDEKLVAGVAGDLGFDLRDVEMDVKRAQKEHAAGGALSDQETHERGFKESTMRITKRQLKRIIKEQRGPRPDDDYDPLNPDAEFGGESPEDDMDYDRGLETGCAGWPRDTGFGPAYDTGYDQGEMDAKDPDSECNREHAEEFGQRRESVMKITKRQLNRLIREALSSGAQELEPRLVAVWEQVSADTLQALGGQASWEEISEEVMASGYSIDPDLIESINLLPFEEQQKLFQKTFGAGRKY
jgi:hypothetical protein